MKIVPIIFVLFFFCSINAQSSLTDTLKVVTQTKYGELTFTKYCKNDKLEFVQSDKPIFDSIVEQEARNRNITRQKLKLKITIDSLGKLKSCELVKPSKLKSLDMFLLAVFNEAILKSKKIDYTLNCNRIEKTYLMSVVYKPQKTK